MEKRFSIGIGYKNPDREQFKNRLKSFVIQTLMIRGLAVRSLAVQTLMAELRCEFHAVPFSNGGRDLVLVCWVVGKPGQVGRIWLATGGIGSTARGCRGRKYQTFRHHEVFAPKAHGRKASRLGPYSQWDYVVCRAQSRVSPQVPGKQTDSSFTRFTDRRAVPAPEP